MGTVGGQDSSSQIFLLSPASLSGERARQLTSPEARFDAARRYRSSDGVPIEEAFTFLSSLYFRGKIAYARHFARPPAELPGSGGDSTSPCWHVPCKLLDASPEGGRTNEDSR